MKFTATVNGSALTKNDVENTATIEIRNLSIQTNDVENPVPDKDVDSDGDGNYGDNGKPVNVGDTLTYRVDYHNSYDDPTDVTITDTLDEGLD
ncbi:MAG: hypothetical protein LIO56_06005, partial [Lachnospiraceae bacterium]|nr:hypothetical protein [Lachnospiraceae bacterium]